MLIWASGHSVRRFPGCLCRAKKRGAIRRDIDLRIPHERIHHSAEIFQARDRFYLVVGESEAQSLWFHATGRGSRPQGRSISPFVAVSPDGQVSLLYGVLGDPPTPDYALGGRNN